MTTRRTSTLLLALLALGVTAGCGARANAGAGTDVALSAAGRDLEDRASGDRDGDGDDDRWDDAMRVSYLESVLNQLRAVPPLAPLFDRYGVPTPIGYDDEARGLVSLLRAVRIRIAFGALTITNRETGGVIFTAPMIDLASGALQPDHLPGAAPRPPSAVACAEFRYGDWGACQPDGTQARAVLAASPAGCSGGARVTSQTCSVAPPAPAVSRASSRHRAHGATPHATRRASPAARTPAWLTARR